MHRTAYVSNESRMKTKQNAKSKKAHGTSQNTVICRQMQPKCLGQNEHAFRANEHARHLVNAHKMDDNECILNVVK